MSRHIIISISDHLHPLWPFVTACVKTTGVLLNSTIVASLLLTNDPVRFKGYRCDL